jgi:hypothetical protein
MNDGERNPRYRDGRRMYKNLVDLTHCAICGKKQDPKNPHSIEAHHGDGNRSHNTKDNLTPLCNTGPNSCHRLRRAVKSGNIVADVSTCKFPLEVRIDASK